MSIPTEYIDDFYENLEGLMEDLILLSSLDPSPQTSCSPLLCHLPPRIFQQTQQRILDYLTQHAVEAYHAVQRIEKAQGA